MGKVWQIQGLPKPISTGCPHCQAAREAKELELRQHRVACAKQAKIAQLAGNAGIPERFITRTFDNYQAKTLEQQQILQITRHYAEQFEERLAQGGGLILAGTPGTGKTHLSAAIANQVIKMGHSVLFLSALRALRLVKDCYRRSNPKTIMNPEIRTTC